MRKKTDCTQKKPLDALRKWQCIHSRKFVHARADALGQSDLMCLSRYVRDIGLEKRTVCPQIPREATLSLSMNDHYCNPPWPLKNPAVSVDKLSVRPRSQPPLCEKKALLSCTPWSVHIPSSTDHHQLGIFVSPPQIKLSQKNCGNL